MQQPAFLARIWHKLYKRNRANCQRVRTGFGAPARTGFGTDFGTELAHEPFLCSSQGVSARFGGDMFLGHTAAASSEDEGRRFFGLGVSNERSPVERLLDADRFGNATAEWFVSVAAGADEGKRLLRASSHICGSDGRLAQRICVDLELSVKEVETGQCNKIAL